MLTLTAVSRSLASLGCRGGRPLLLCPARQVSMRRMIATVVEPTAPKPSLLKRIFGNKSFIRFLRICRVVIVALGIYRIGYHDGIVDFIENPDEQRELLVRTVLASSNSTDVLEDNCDEVKLVSQVAKRVLEAARIIVSEEILTLEKSVEKSRLGTKEESAASIRMLNDAKAIEQRLAGQWFFFVTDSKDVNAFVADIFPKTIFVNKGFLDKIDPSTDELAMVLAHELSHVIHDHNRERSYAQMVIYTVQLMLFALIDPTGEASVIFDALAGFFVDILIATHSRTNEEEADLTGIQIMNKACYDPVRGANVFIKLGTTNGNEIKKSTGWTDTHPNSHTRAEYITSAAKLYKIPNECLEIQHDLEMSRRYVLSKK